MPEKTTVRDLPSQVISHDRLLDEIPALLSVAYALFRNERSAEVNALLETALTLFEQLPAGSRKDALAANMKTLFGMTLTAENRQVEAAEQFLGATHIYTGLGDNAGLYYLKVAEGIRLRDSGRASEALGLFREAEAIDRMHNVGTSVRHKHSLQIDIVGALIQTAAEGEVVRQVDEALKWIPTEYSPELASLLLMKGNYSTFFGWYAEAHEAYRKGLDVAEGLHDAEMKARLLERLALCYRTQAEQTADANTMRESASFRRMALEVHTARGAVEDALRQYHELVSACQSLQEYGAARETCLNAADMASQFERPSEEFRFVAHAGFLSVKLEDYDQALNLYTRAYRLPSVPEERQRVVAELARLHYAKGEMGDAVRLFYESCELLVQIGDQSGEAVERGVLAYLLNKLGRADEAKPHLSRSQELRGRG